MKILQMNKVQFSSHCDSFGYTVAEAMPCVVSQNGDVWDVNVESGFFPQMPKPWMISNLASSISPPARHGPGTELHSLLKKFGITATGDCKCDSRVAYMNKMEAEQPGWCEANIEEIVGWLRESAGERGLPFLDVAGRVLVRRAIANARRKEAARVAQEASDRPHVHAEPR